MLHPGRLLTDPAPDGTAAPADLRLERPWYLEFDPADLWALTEDGRLPETGRVPATLIVLRLDTDLGPVSARGEQIAADSTTPARMLAAAALNTEVTS